MPVFVQIPENPNCDAVEGQIFECRAKPRIVTHVTWERHGENHWCPLTGLDEDGKPCDAVACIVEDSGEGACYLVTGGAWGLRAKHPSDPGPWDVNNPDQWGIPYLLLGADNDDLRFTD